MKVLIINTHGLGDVIMTFPIIKSVLEKGYEPAFLLKSPLEGQLIRHFFPSLEKSHFIYMSKVRLSRLPLLDLIRKVRAFKPEAVIPVYSIEPKRLSFINFLSGAKHTIGFGGAFSLLNKINVKEKIKGHKVEFNFSLLNKLLYRLGEEELTSPQMPIYTFNHSLLSSALRKLNLTEGSLVNFIGIAPGSGEVEAHKRWPIEKYAKLAKRLIKHDFNVIVLGGPGEEALSKEITHNISSQSHVIDAVGKLSIDETLAVLSQLKALIANCNGLSHMAAAVDIPVLGIYGPTDFYKTGPWSMKAIQVTQSFECSPCYRRGFTRGCGNPVCMTEIDVDTVLKKFIEHIGYTNETDTSRSQ